MLFKIRFVDIIFWIAVIMADIAIYAFIGILLSNYEDNYNPSDGDYGNFCSMTNFDILSLILLYIWHMLNVVFIAVNTIKIYKWLKAKPKAPNA